MIAILSLISVCYIITYSYSAQLIYFGNRLFFIHSVIYEDVNIIFGLSPPPPSSGEAFCAFDNPSGQIHHSTQKNTLF